MGPDSLAIDPVVLRGVAAALSVVLILGALVKLRDMELFRYAVDNYRLLPDALVPGFAWGFALSELAAGVGLLFPASQGWAAWLALAVLGLASAGVLINLSRGIDRIECGCGTGGQRISAGLVARNGVLAALVALCATDELPRALGLIDHFSVAGIALVLLALYASANQLLANQPLLKEIHS